MTSFVLALLALSTIPTTHPPRPDDARAALTDRTVEFIENRGQWDPRARFAARTGDAWVFLAADGFRMSLAGSTAPDASRERADLFFTFEDARPEVALHAKTRTESVRSYFVGDPERFAADVPSYGEVYYRDLLPGVDVHCYDRDGRLEYDLIVASGVDPSSIVLRCEGADRISMEDDGSLRLVTPLGEVRHALPRSVAVDAQGRTREVRVRMRRLDAERFVFEAEERRLDERLVIDPVLLASTRVGGGYHDEANDVAVDANGYVYVCGTTWSPDYPASPGYKTGLFGVSDDQDAFVTKLTPDLSKKIYSTYYGSIGHDSGNAIAVNGLGQACVVGCADGWWIDLLNPSPNTVPTWGGADILIGMFTANGTALVTGGVIRLAGRDEATGVAFVDNDTYALTGTVDQGDLPATGGAYDTSYNGDDDAFVMVLDVANYQSTLRAATYLGGSDEDDGEDLCFAANSLFVTGRTRSTNLRLSGNSSPGAAADPTQNGPGTEDAFVARFSLALALQYVTFLGGAGDDTGRGIAADNNGNAWFIGDTKSTSGFPATNVSHLNNPGLTGRDVYLARLNPTGTSFAAVTRFGGSDTDRTGGIARDPSGHLWVTGLTKSTDFPLNAPYQSSKQGADDAFVCRFNASGSLVFSTYLGGGQDDDGNGVAAAGVASAVVVGLTESTNFPVTSTGLQGGVPDAFATLLQDCALVFSKVTDCGGGTAGGPTMYASGPSSVKITGLSYFATPYFTISYLDPSNPTCKSKPLTTGIAPIGKVSGTTAVVDLSTVPAPFLCGQKFRLQAAYVDPFGWWNPSGSKTEQQSNALLIAFQ